MANETLQYTVKVDTGEVTKAQKQIEQFKKSLSAKDEKGAIKGWKQYEKATEKVETARDNGSFKNYQKNVAKMQKIKQKYNKKFGSGWGESYDNAENMEKLTKSTKKGESAMAKFGKKMKEIAAGAFIWNVISKAVQNIANSFKEGLTNLYNFQKAAGGGALTKAMDTISSKFKALKNAIGSVVANFIIAVEPFLTSAIDMLIQLFNKISAVIAKLFGQSSYMEASAGIMDSWKDNNEETKKLISGLDSLNILETSSSALSAENGEDYFKTVQLTEENDPFKGLKDLWNDSIKPWFESAWGTIKSWFKSTVWPTVYDLWANTIWPSIVSFFSEWFSQVWNETTLAKNWRSFWGLDPVEMTQEEYDEKYTPEHYEGDGSFFSEAWASVKNFFSTFFRNYAPTGTVITNATGGVYTKPTLGLVGEYSNAASNPEIISPKSLMKETVQEANGNVVSALVQCTRQLVQAVNEKNLNVNIGDETIGAAAARANDAYYKMSGVAKYQ